MEFLELTTAVYFEELSIPADQLKIRTYMSISDQIVRKPGIRVSQECE
jgi:hypothetical protein